MTIDQINEHDDFETREPRVVTKSELDTIELSVNDMLNEGKSGEEIRESISDDLENIGQAPLAENETQRTFLISIDDETVERTIVLSPNNFGDTVSSTRDMGIEGFTETSPEVETSAARVERLLGETALSDAINEGVSVDIASRLRQTPEVAATVVEEGDSDDSENEANPEDEKLVRTYESFKRLTNGFRHALDRIQQTNDPNEAIHFVGQTLRGIDELRADFPNASSDRATQYKLEQISSITADLENRMYTTQRAIGEGGLKSEPLRLQLIDMQHHGLLSAMIQTSRELGNER